MNKREKNMPSLNRRKFIQMSTALAAGGAISTSSLPTKIFAQESENITPKIKKYRTLGRTGFEVSDISMGCTRSKDPNVYRYAYDCGMNYYDTAEGYQSGDSERNLGMALKNMDRKKVFVTTKLPVSADESEKSIQDRFWKCMERLDTEYIDALYMHSVKEISLLDKIEFHAVANKMKSEGKIRFVGVSSHGPRNENQDSMEKVLTAAALDGRFDLMLLVYNFMNRKAAENILKACKEKNVGTTAMKTAPGVLKVDDYNPDNPTETQKRQLQRLKKRYDTEEEIDAGMEKWLKNKRETFEKTKPFMAKYGVKSEDELRIASIRWVMDNPDMHSTCVSFRDFDSIDKMVPYSGQKLSELETGFLKNYQDIFNEKYCRHGCHDCMHRCPHHMPVSTIMRYAYYFEHQGREKEAMDKYRRMTEEKATVCEDCHAPCLSACKFHLDIPAQLMAAHNLLTLA